MVVLTKELREVAKEFSQLCNKSLIRLVSVNESNITYIVGNKELKVISLNAHNGNDKFICHENIKNYNCLLYDSSLS